MKQDTGELVPVIANPNLAGGELLPPVFGGKQPRSLAELRPVIESVFESWLKKTESEATRTAYRTDVKQFLEFHGLNPEQIEHMTRFVPDDIATWRDHLLAQGGRVSGDGQERSPARNSTVARKMTALRSFFSYLQNGGYRGGNPAHPDFVRAPSVPSEGLTPAIPRAKMRELLTAPDASLPVGIRDRAILAMFTYVALRVDELHSINVGNIGKHGEHIVVDIKGKGNKELLRPVPPGVLTLVNAWIEKAAISEDRSGPLFRPGASPRGKGFDGFKRKRLTVSTIQKLVKKYCKEVGIDQAVSVHSLRVTAATEAQRAGMELVRIQHWLGHEDPRTTLRYIRAGKALEDSPAYKIDFG